MDRRDAEERPARFGFGDDARDLGLGHPGIMLDLERRQTPALVAAEADEGHQRADVDAPGGERARLGGGVEILGLDAHRRPSPQPPVIGGKKAISRAPAILASCPTWARSIAARITRGRSKAWA